MTQSNPGSPEPVKVAEMPIELCQFMKFGGLTQSGGEAKQVIGEGRVLVNGVVETRKRKKLSYGDSVSFAGRTIVVEA
jgi:ribosome-associated protein